MLSRFDFSVRTAVFLLVAILLTFTWVLTGVGKFMSEGVPPWFQEQFGKSLLAAFPGLTASYYSIAVLEVIAALVSIGSLLSFEWLSRRPPILLQISLVLSMLTFLVLGFGKRLVADHAGAHDLFMYFAATLVMLMAVRGFRCDEQTKEVRA